MEKKLDVTSISIEHYLVVIYIVEINLQIVLHQHDFTTIN